MDIARRPDDLRQVLGYPSRGPLAIFSPTLRFPKARTRAGLLKLEGEMRKAETGHVLIFVVVLLYTGWRCVPRARSRCNTRARATRWARSRIRLR